MEASSFQVSIPCFSTHLKLPAKEPQMFRNDTIGLLEIRLSRIAWVARSVVGLLQTTAFVLGTPSSVLNSLYLRERVATTRRWLDAMWG